ncbi:ABC transporter ATP-binding protein [Methanolobus halotolerans]|uniref:Sodium ABC transporter ATP-binding protein n=1 Tax=Methanolobus halotolerans TaxID=2052935 RepID=A0A4E0QAJ7_9EURY|nr:ABC transporter ATP-binding protein [Methanolobus halotolerans]TGC09477.1 sodium ABC transporter ATP-binding protein [Methanolobus halotolerans]
MDPIISARGIQRSFGKHKALRNIDLEIKKGESVAIFGPNGAGKTTLLKVLSTIIMPTKGNVIVNGIDLRRDSSSVRELIGVISHQTYLYDGLTARENLRFFGKMYGMERSLLEERIRELLGHVGLLGRADDRVGAFSRGMKQRLSIARALVHRPEVLFMDEPYTGLDQRSAKAFENVLRALDKDKVTKIMVSHNIERAMQLCDRLIVMDRGEIVYDRMAKEIEGKEDFKLAYSSLICMDTDAEGVSNLW